MTTKQYVFSARTTAEGLRILGGLKAKLGVNWDRLIVDAVNAHYGVEVPMPVLVGPTPEQRAKGKADKAEAKAKAKAEREGKAKAKAAEDKAKAKAKAKAEADKNDAEVNATRAAEKAAKLASVRFIPASKAVAG